MKRFHVHVAVENLTDSITFYSDLFGAKPAVERPDYAKWMLEIRASISRYRARP